MKLKGMRKLEVFVALGAGLLATVTGCANMPKPAKIALTPLTAARDAVDLPLASMASFWDAVAEAGKERFGETDTYGYWSSDSGPGIGVTVDVTYPVGKALSYTFGGIDYAICRSLYPNFPDGLSPWKEKGERWKEFLFPSTRALWKEE